MHTYSLQGITLDRWAVLHGSTHQAGVSIRRSVVEIPGRPGAVLAGRGVPDEASVTLILAPRIEGPQRGDLELLLADLMALHTAPSLILSRSGFGRSTQAEVSLVSIAFNEDDYLCGRRAVATVLLSMPGVWWRDAAYTTSPALTTTAPALTTGVGSAPVTDAVIRFNTSAVNPSIIDVTSGTGLSVTSTANTTTYTYLDAGNLSAWTSTSSSAWTRPVTRPLDRLVSYPGPGPLRLTPSVSEDVDGVLHRSVPLALSHGAVVRFKGAWW